MKNKPWIQAIITTLVCLAPMILSVMFWDNLPEQMPIHWGADGEVNGWASKSVACFAIPVGMAALNLFVHFALNADPKRKNAQSGLLWYLGLWAVPVINLILMPVTIFAAMGYDVPIGIIVCSLVGVLFIIIGNYLPKTKQNYTVGIKIPWTLNNEDNWNKTHRFAGGLWMIGGAIMVATSFIASNIIAFISVIAIILITVVVPFIYSYTLHRKGM